MAVEQVNPNVQQPQQSTEPQNYTPAEPNQTLITDGDKKPTGQDELESKIGSGPEKKSDIKVPPAPEKKEDPVAKAKEEQNTKTEQTNQKQTNSNVQKGTTTKAVGGGIAVAGAAVGCAFPPAGAIIAAIGAIVGLIGMAIESGAKKQGEAVAEAGARQKANNDKVNDKKPPVDPNAMVFQGKGASPAGKSLQSDGSAGAVAGMGAAEKARLTKSGTPESVKTEQGSHVAQSTLDASKVG